MSDARTDGPGADRTDHADEMHPPSAGDPVEHLWNAAHEFLAAARAVIDAADAVVIEQQRRAAVPRAPRLRRIDVQ